MNINRKISPYNHSAGNNIQYIWEVKMQKKVSIITPCYNGEMYVERMLNSVLEQDYNNIEFILINDGSTDKTEAIVKKYETKFKKKGIDFIYIYQSNSGQAAALNKGLAIFKGDYLTWPDSDDMLSKDSISKKVEFLILQNICRTPFPA